MRILVGLGNPGPRYADNRHNIGFMAAEAIARRHGFGPWRRRFQALVAEGRVGNDKALLVEPQTYMNESGRSVGEAVRFYKAEPGAVFVFHDELDLKAGKVRVKRGGGHGGHNGIRSIAAHIGPEFWRVRLGIGHPGDKDRVHGHVLGDFAKADRAWLDPLLDALAEELPLLLKNDEAAYMSRLALALQPAKAPRRKTASTNEPPAPASKPVEEAELPPWKALLRRLSS